MWPDEPGKQRVMEHLDFAVDDLEKQFSPEAWIVMLDPEGHPYCLWLNKWLLDRPDCVLC